MPSLLRVGVLDIAAGKTDQDRPPSQMLRSITIIAASIACTGKVPFFIRVPPMRTPSPPYFRARTRGSSPQPLGTAVNQPI